MNTATQTAASTQPKKNVGLLKTPPATLCFPHLFVPRAPALNAEPRYSCLLLFDQAAQEMPAYKALRQGVLEAVQIKHGAKAKELLKQLRLPFRDAGEKEYNGFEPGMIFIQPWSKTDKPQVIDRNGNDILIPGDVFAGQLVRAAVRPFYYENTGNKGVSFGLHSIQIIDADKPRLDGRQSAKSVFDDGEYGSTDTDDTEDF
jgi:hypothetical protein